MLSKKKVPYITIWYAIASTLLVLTTSGCVKAGVNGEGYAGGDPLETLLSASRAEATRALNALQTGTNLSNLCEPRSCDPEESACALVRALGNDPQKKTRIKNFLSSTQVTKLLAERSQATDFRVSPTPLYVSGSPVDAMTQLGPTGTVLFDAERIRKKSLSQLTALWTHEIIHKIDHPALSRPLTDGEAHFEFGRGSEFLDYSGACLAVYAQGMGATLRNISANFNPDMLLGDQYALFNDILVLGERELESCGAGTTSQPVFLGASNAPSSQSIAGSWDSCGLDYAGYLMSGPLSGTVGCGASSNSVFSGGNGIVRDCGASCFSVADKFKKSCGGSKIGSQSIQVQLGLRTRAGYAKIPGGQWDYCSLNYHGVGYSTQDSAASCFVFPKGDGWVLGTSGTVGVAHRDCRAQCLRFPRRSEDAQFGAERVNVSVSLLSASGASSLVFSNKDYQTCHLAYVGTESHGVNFGCSLATTASGWTLSRSGNFPERVDCAASCLKLQ